MANKTFPQLSKINHYALTRAKKSIGSCACEKWLEVAKKARIEMQKTGLMVESKRS